MQGTVIVTGVGRAVGIGAAVAVSLNADGWNVVTVGWRGYDERMPWGADTSAISSIEADLGDPGAPSQLFEAVNRNHGVVTALVCCHCESVDSSILTTSVESFDRHFNVNARATWLLIRALAQQFPATATTAGSGRIVAITSDHTPFNLPYGASKGALDRIVLAAAVELAHLGITANVINPGATDTGWMTPEIEAAVVARNVQPRIGLPTDCANLIRFLLSPEGQWINGQLLYSDGGLKP